MAPGGWPLDVSAMAADGVLLLAAGDPTRGVELGVERDDAPASTDLLLAV